MPLDISLKPRLFVLLAFTITLSCISSENFATIAPPCHLGSVCHEVFPSSDTDFIRSRPPPADTLPNQPSIMPGFMLKSITVSSFPSLIPVNSACSDFFSRTLTLLMILAGMFLDASCGSSRKNVLPSMVIFDMVSPLAVMLPSESTSTPGSFFSKSSSMSLSVVLNEEAEYSIVSFLITTGLATAVTTAPSSRLGSSSILNFPRETSDLSTLISVANGLYPINSHFTIYSP